MQFHRPLALVGTVVLAASLAACGHSRPAPASQYSGGYSSGYQTAPAYPQQQVGTEYGRVSNIEVLQGSSQGQTTGTGAVLGAVVGGVLGGAVAGNAIEGRNNQEYVQGYRLSVQLDQGGYRVYDVSSPGDLRIGDRVRLYNGQISRM